MEIVVRPATVADADQLGVAHVAAWQTAYAGLIPAEHLDRMDPVAQGERHRQGMTDGVQAGQILVAQVDDRVAGFAAFGPPRDDMPDGWGELRAINLHPDFWRQRIGSKLFAAATAGLAKLGYRHGYLWVLDGNERATGFYRSRGWPPDGQTKADDRFDPPLIELRCSADLLAA
jgi:GNAT superfamily N-acetyltransferase